MPRLSAAVNLQHCGPPGGGGKAWAKGMLSFRLPVLIAILAALLPGADGACAQGANATEDGVAPLPAQTSEAPARDLALSQDRKGECAPGGECEYLITVTNKGAEDFSSMVNVLHTASFRPRRHKSSDEVACSRKRSVVACRTGQVHLAPGQSVAFTLELRVPRNARGEARNCALLAFRGGELDDPLEDLVTIVQLALQARGLYADGEVDGKPGSKLSAAIDTFRADNGLPEGEIDAELIRVLFGPAGLMDGDGDALNDHVCDTFELPKAVANQQIQQRSIYRRVQTRQSGTINNFGATPPGSRRSRSLFETIH